MQVLAYIAAALIAVWGVAHALPTKRVVAWFGPIPVDYRRVFTQEWPAESFTMWAMATVVVAVTAAACDTQVTGGVGDSFDNALAENLWSAIKIELIYWPATTFAMRTEAQAALFRYINGWYNSRRIQAGLSGALARPVRGWLAGQPPASTNLQYPYLLVRRRPTLRGLIETLSRPIRKVTLKWVHPKNSPFIELCPLDYRTTSSWKIGDGDPVKFAIPPRPSHRVKSQREVARVGPGRLARSWDHVMR